MTSTQAALAAWAAATLAVGGGYVVFRVLRGELPRWRSLAEAALAAGAYAAWLGWRFRERRAGDEDAGTGGEGTR